MTKRVTMLLPLLFAAALAACEPTGDEMGTKTGPMPQTPPPIVVRDQQRHLAIDLLPGGVVSAGDWVRIDHFLGDAAPGRLDTAHLKIAGNVPPAVIDLVLRHAFAFGYAENKIEIGSPKMAHGPRPQLLLTSRAYIAQLPNCPQTQHLNIIDGDNQISSDWGCSSVANLELQVADPRDLVRGQSGGQTDSVMTTAAITRLQTDKLKKLDTSSTTAGTAATPGGQ